MEDIFSKRAKDKALTVQAPQAPMRPEAVVPNEMITIEKKAPKRAKTSLVEDVIHGLQRSSLAAPFVKPQEQQAETFGGRLAESVGEVAGDVPAMAGGGALGGLGGAALGSLAGPIGTAVGALLGGGAGAFAAPEAVKSIARESRKGGPILDAAGNVVKDIGKAGLIGAATGAAGKIAGPVLSRFGGQTGEKILSSALGRGATEAAGELAGMTGAQYQLGDEITPEAVAQNALLLGGMKGAGVLGRKLPLKKPEIYNFEEMFKKPTTERIAAHKLVREHIGERAAKTYLSQMNWREALQKAEEKGGKFTPQQLEDMIYYRQRTGSLKEGDTFEKVRERLPENARRLVDTTINDHLVKSLKDWNENPYTKDIKPREGLEEVYLPGLYEGTPGELDRAAAQVSKRFKTKNPFGDAKTFLNYNEAFREAGLKPRFKNIIDLLKHYDEVMIKSAANSEFASKLKEMKGKDNKAIIIRPMNSDAYKKAQQNNWVPFHDTFLKRYVAGTSKEGKPIWATSERPVLIDPDFAPALQGVFSKEAYKPEYKAWKYYDAVNDTMKRMAVHLPLVNKIPGFIKSPFSLMASPFHAIALTEHALSDMGTRSLAGIKAGKELLKNKEAVSDALRHGVTLERGDVEGREKNYLFGTLQPSMKLGSYNLFTQDAINKLVKEGNPPSKEQISDIKRSAAEFVNNVYGGQNWELLNWFNDKNNLKKARRTAGYLDWSTSALRNAGQIFKTGFTGEKARSMWLKYGLGLAGTRAVIDAFNRSLVQTDDKEKSVAGIQFDPDKFFKNLSLIGQPGQRTVFALPDITVKLPFVGEWNPGRDRENHRRFGHFGKSAFEVLHYGSKLWPQLFSKSAPLLQQAYKQVTGYSPTEYEPFAVQPGYKGGQRVPWGGKEGYDKFTLRAKELALSFAPFSLRGANTKSATLGEEAGDVSSRYFASLGGAFPVSKGLTPFKSKLHLKQAIKSGNEKRVEQLRNLLLENGYEEKKVDKQIRAIRNELANKGEEE